MILLDSLSAVTIDLCKSTCVFHLRNLIQHTEIIYVFVAVEIVVLFLLIRYGGRKRRYGRRALDKSQGDLFDSSRFCEEINKYAFKNLMGEAIIQYSGNKEILHPAFSPLILSPFQRALLDYIPDL